MFCTLDDFYKSFKNQTAAMRKIFSVLTDENLGQAVVAELDRRESPRSGRDARREGARHLRPLQGGVGGLRHAGA